MRVTMILESGGNPRPFLFSYPELVRSCPRLRRRSADKDLSTPGPDRDGITRRVPLFVFSRRPPDAGPRARNVAGGYGRGRARNRRRASEWRRRAPRSVPIFCRPISMAAYILISRASYDDRVSSRRRTCSTDPMIPARLQWRRGAVGIERDRTGGSGVRLRWADAGGRGLGANAGIDADAEICCAVRRSSTVSSWRSYWSRGS